MSGCCWSSKRVSCPAFRWQTAGCRRTGTQWTRTRARPHVASLCGRARHRPGPSSGSPTGGVRTRAVRLIGCSSAVRSGGRSRNRVTAGLACAPSCGPGIPAIAVLPERPGVLVAALGVLQDGQLAASRPVAGSAGVLVSVEKVLAGLVQLALQGRQRLVRAAPPGLHRPARRRTAPADQHAYPTIMSLIVTAHSRLLSGIFGK